MRYRFMYCGAVLMSVIFVATFAPLEARTQSNGESFDPRDLSGIWFRGGGVQRGDRAFGPRDTIPAMTPEGEAKARTIVPQRGSRVDFMEVADFPGQSNDPTIVCNPTGFPRILVDTAPEIFEFIHTDGRLLQLHQLERAIRELWMDGREVPSHPHLMSRDLRASHSSRQ